MPERDAWGREVVTTGSAPTVMADSVDPMTIPRAGTVLGGKYRVERVLGQGGMGLVLEATHLGLAQRVAIKFLRNEAKAVTGALDRFAREARACAQVQSEHVVRVFDTGVFESGEPYIVMELLAGEDLRTVLARRGPLPPGEIASLAIEACEALSLAHALGIVHRDLKPANLFVATRPDGSGVLKVLDFGISKLHAEHGAQTSANVTLGSPRYMSPEQIQTPRDVDARTDVWALGVVLYEALAARPPFDAEGMVALATAIATAEPSPLPPGVPPEVARVVLRCLEKDRRRRFASAAELAVALRPFASVEAQLVADRIARAAGGAPVSSSHEARISGFEPTAAWQGSDPMVARSGVVAKRKAHLAGLVASASVLLLVAGGVVTVLALRASHRASVAAPSSAAASALASPASAPAALEPLAPVASVTAVAPSTSVAPAAPPRAPAQAEVRPHATFHAPSHATGAAPIATAPPPRPTATAASTVDLAGALRDRK